MKVTSLDQCGFYNTSFLREIEEELQRKLFLVMRGLDTFTKSEKFAYEVLKSQGFFHTEDSIPSTTVPLIPLAQ
jgi:hypothetical protein